MTDKEIKRDVTLVIKDLNSDNYGYESIVELLALGCTIKEAHVEKYQQHFITITLPQGFYLGERRVISGFYHLDFFDTNGNRRGSFNYKINDPKVSTIKLSTKYRVLSKRYNASSSDCKFEKIYFGNEKK